MLGKRTGRFHPWIEVERLRLFEVIRGKLQPVVEGSLRVKLGGRTEYVAAEGEGPVRTLFMVLKDALLEEEAGLGELAGYVRALSLKAVRVRTFYPRGTRELKARVTITLADGERSFTTIGISGDLIQAVWQALLDGMEYGLYTEAERRNLVLS